MIKATMRTGNSPSLLIIRLTLGGVMFAHGAQKVFGWFGGHGFIHTINLFTNQLQFYIWVPILVMAVELLGSILLVLGLFTRLSALAIGSVITVCAYMNHLPNGFFMNWFGQQKGEGYEYHLLVIGISLALVVSGGGFLSVDSLFESRRRKFFLK